jgi:uracil-DNA glycosylase family 4
MSGVVEMAPAVPVARIEEEVVACTRCSRLRDYCTAVAREKRRAYRDQEYWGKPVPAFGDPAARLLIVGLAPAAHGANRTGRMFTGDSSGNFLYRALHATGFASQPVSVARGDGLTLRNCFITASLRCAPPANKPLPQELRNCRPFLERELDALDRVRVVVALGRIAFDTYLGILRDRGQIGSRGAFKFGHNAVHKMGGTLPVLISSYHPSQQNTSTGKLTDSMLRAVFRNAARLIARVDGVK